jgi:hypothetical protein
MRKSFKRLNEHLIGHLITNFPLVMLSVCNIREFTIYDATGSTTRFQNKEICHARQKL